jgi:hypothetical protein
MEGVEMSVKISSLVSAFVVLSTLANGADFVENWETAPIGEYTPSAASFIHTNQGYWYLGDTVSEFPEDCGPTPHRGQVLMHNGSRALRLTSNESDGGCGDNVWVALAEYPSYNRGFAVALVANTVISFEEVGELVAPGLHGWGRNCLFPPCFDNVSVLLMDNRNNILAYVMQRYEGATENTPNSNFGDTYREIFLDPAAGSYSRNLFADFQTIPTFTATGAQIRSIEFRVDEHGWAIIDNLRIGLPDLPVVTVQASDPGATENGLNTAEFTVSRTGSMAAPLTVSYSISGSATADVDYEGLPGSVTIPLGSPSTTIVLTPLEDAQSEPAETVSITLSPDAAYLVGATAQATATISDNDCAAFDMNWDGFISIIGDVPAFVRMVYFGDNEWYQQQFPGKDPSCPADCNGDGIISIVGDVPCFVNCAYFGNCRD